jgi:soluble lytic murein transglycosylase-like protein
MSVIAALILTIAVEFGLPPNFVLAIALTENETLDPLAVNVNKNGTTDRGIFQLSDRYFDDERIFEPEYNIRTACKHIKELVDDPAVNTYWTCAACYNSGRGWLKGGSPPDTSIEYANKVMDRWNRLTNGNAMTVIGGKR